MTTADTERPDLDTWVPATEQLPTMPGKVDGVISIDPLVIQCRTCGATYTSYRGVAFSIIISRSGFHYPCTPDGGRLCRDCLQAALDTCEKRRHT